MALKIIIPISINKLNNNEKKNLKVVIVEFNIVC